MKSILFSLLSLLLVVIQAGAQSITEIPYHHYAKPIIVDVTEPWTDTGIDLTANLDTVEIIVKGIASSSGSSDKNEVGWVGPEGDGSGIAPATFNVPGVPGQSVIGKVGDSGTGFYVGAERVFVPNVSGRLFLGYNDNPSGSWSGNFGYYIAFVIAPLSSSQSNSVKPSTETKSLTISQNHPNPFNPNTTISFNVPARTRVNVTVFNTEGQAVRTLLDDQCDAGSYNVVWDGLNDASVQVATGAYFYQVRVGSLVQTKKMLLLR